MQEIKTLIDELRNLLSLNDEMAQLYFVVSSYLQKDGKAYRKDTLSKLDDPPKWAKYFTDDTFKDWPVSKVILDYLESIKNESKRTEMTIGCKYWSDLVMLESATSLPNITEENGIQFAMKSPLALWLFDYSVSVQCILLILSGLSTSQKEYLCIIRNLQLISKFKLYIEPHIIEYCIETKNK